MYSTFSEQSYGRFCEVCRLCWCWNTYRGALAAKCMCVLWLMSFSHDRSADLPPQKHWWWWQTPAEMTESGVLSGETRHHEQKRFRDQTASDLTLTAFISCCGAIIRTETLLWKKIKSTTFLYFLKKTQVVFEHAKTGLRDAELLRAVAGMLLRGC